MSNIGEVTVRILSFNNFERLLEWQTLREIERYPTEEALERMS